MFEKISSKFILNFLLFLMIITISIQLYRFINKGKLFGLTNRTNSSLEVVISSHYPGISLWLANNIRNHFEKYTTIEINTYYDKTMIDKRVKVLNRALKHAVIGPSIYPNIQKRKEAYNILLTEEEMLKLDYKNMLKYNFKWYLGTCYLYLPKIHGLKTNKFSLYFYKNHMFLLPTIKEKQL